MKVEVYRNLRTGGYSIRQKGIVIKLADTVELKNVKMVVQPAGNAKVNAEGRKNVHAFFRGELVAADQEPTQEYKTAVTYNPYENDYFYNKETKEKVTEAKAAYLKGTCGWI